MTPEPEPPEKPKRQSRDELRAQVLDAGVALLQEHGVEFKLDNLTFQRVFAKIEQETGRRIVPAMVYERIWRNQEDYRWNVLNELIRRGGFANGPTLEAISTLVEATDVESEPARHHTLVELCRVAGRADLAAIREDRDWWIAVAAIGATTSTPGDYDDGLVAPIVRENLLGQLRTYSVVYEWTFNRLGYRLKPAFTLEEFTLALGSLAEGVGLRQHYMERISEERDVDLGSGLVPWSVYGMAILGIVNLMVEPDPAFDPNAERFSLDGAMAELNASSETQPHQEAV